MTDFNVSKTRMKGTWIPSFLNKLFGFIHMKFHMVEQTGDDYYMMKSPYLIRIKHYYLEYKARIHILCGKELSSIQRVLYEKDAEKQVLSHKIENLQNKITSLTEESLTTCNEIRMYRLIQKENDELEERIARINAEIVERQKSIDELLEYEQLCLNRMLEVAISRSYSYIEGCQFANRKCGFYTRKEDYYEELFQIISTEDKIAA